MLFDMKIMINLYIANKILGIRLFAVKLRLKIAAVYPRDGNGRRALQ